MSDFLNPVTVTGLLQADGDTVSRQTITDGAADVHVTADDTTPPQEAQYNVQIIGTNATKYDLLSGTTKPTGIIDMRDLSELRSFWLVLGTGTGTVTVTATPCSVSSGGIRGDDQALGADLAVSTILDIPLSTLPYAPYYIFNFEETNTADIEIYAFLTGRGGA